MGCKKSNSAPRTNVNQSTGRPSRNRHYLARKESSMLTRNESTMQRRKKRFTHQFALSLLAVVLCVSLTFMSVGHSECSEGDESNNLFSPAVYLLYLLDFVNRSFGAELDTLDEVNEKFYQNFGDLSTDFDPSQRGSYVQFSNEILENLIADLDGDDWPNEIVDDQSEEQVRNDIKVAIYEEFKLSVHQNEPGFSPNILVDLFDSYIREFGTTRREVRFIRMGTPDLQEQFAEENNLDNSSSPTDLEAIDVEDQDISLGNIQLLENRLLAFYQRKLQEIVEQEFISNIGDEIRGEFGQYFRQLKNDEVERIFDELTDRISVNDEGLFNQLMGQARSCVELGEDCPVGDVYEGNPISAIRELFKYYAEDYPIYTSKGYSDPDQFADDQFNTLYDVIKYDRYDELAEEAEEAVPPSNPWENADLVLKSEAEAFADERIRSEEEFDNQLHILAGYVYNSRYENETDYQTDVDDVVLSRAEGQWKTAVSRAELGFLSKIRTNLIVLALKKMEESPADSPIVLETVDAAGESLPVVNETNIERLANYLHLDLTVDETYWTTPLSLAINRIHSFVQAVRLGTETPAYSMEDFNENTWGWLKSFGIWHASMMVSGYPENFLTPEWRIGKTPQFQAAKSLDDDDSPDLESIVSQYAEAIDEFRDMRLLKSVTVDDRIFIFAYPAGKDDVYYSVLTETEPWKGWERVPADIDPYGRSPIEMLYINGYLHLFSLTMAENPYNPASTKLNHMSIEVFGNQLRGIETSKSDPDPPEGDSSDTQLPQSSWSNIEESFGSQSNNSWSSFAVVYQKEDETNEEDEADGTTAVRAIAQHSGTGGERHTYVLDFKVRIDEFQSQEPGEAATISGVLLGSAGNSYYALWGRGGDLYLWTGPSPLSFEGLDTAIADGTAIKVAPSMVIGGTDNNFSAMAAHGGGFSPKPDEFILYYRRHDPGTILEAGTIEDVVVRFYKKMGHWYLEVKAAEEELTDSLQVGQIGEDVYMLFNPSNDNTEAIQSSSDWDSQSLYYRNLRTSKRAHIKVGGVSDMA